MPHLFYNGLTTFHQEDESDVSPPMTKGKFDETVTKHWENVMALLPVLSFIIIILITLIITTLSTSHLN